MTRDKKQLTRDSKSSIINQIVDELAWSPSGCEKVVDLFFELMTNKLKEGMSIEIRGLGTFSTKVIQPRERVNIQTGIKYKSPGYTTIKFKPSNKLRSY